MSSATAFLFNQELKSWDTSHVGHVKDQEATILNLANASIAEPVREKGTTRIFGKRGVRGVARRSCTEHTVRRPASVKNVGIFNSRNSVPKPGVVIPSAIKWGGILSLLTVNAVKLSVGRASPPPFVREQVSLDAASLFGHHLVSGSTCVKIATRDKGPKAKPNGGPNRVKDVEEKSAITQTGTRFMITARHVISGRPKPVRLVTIK